MGETKSNIIKRCPRCQSLLLHEANEVYCLMCGWRPLAATVEIKNLVNEELVKHDTCSEFKVGRN